MQPSIAVYVRVSSRQQDLRSQIPDLQRWVTAFGRDEPVKWFTDKFSGKTMNRPSWNKLSDAMAAGLVTKVVCWRLDRLGRTASGLAALFEELQTRKIGFESLKDRIDLGTASGRLMAHILASVAVYENEIRSERIRAGQAVARANGVRWGGSQKGRRLSVTSDQVRLVKKMARDGESKAAIARAVSLSRPTIYRLLDEA